MYIVHTREKSTVVVVDAVVDAVVVVVVVGGGCRLCTVLLSTASLGTKVIRPSFIHQNITMCFCDFLFVLPVSSAFWETNTKTIFEFFGSLQINSLENEFLAALLCVSTKRSQRNAESF
jgi:hypothetical protein